MRVNIFSLYSLNNFLSTFFNVTLICRAVTNLSFNFILVKILITALKTYSSTSVATWYEYANLYWVDVDFHNLMS